MYEIGRKIRNEHHSSQYAHSLFRGLSNTLFLLLKKIATEKLTSESDCSPKKTYIDKKKVFYVCQK